MQTRPYGVKAVSNPLPATGAADPERLDQARTNAPLTVLTFDRLVSVQDYEDFCRAFAGIGAARATAVWKGNRRILHVTIADRHGEPVLKGAPLYNDLLAAIRQRCDPVQQVVLGSERAIVFRLAASVYIDPRHLPVVVLEQARAALRAAFSFPRRGFGQDVSAAEVVTVMHAVPGVAGVDLDALHRSDDAAVAATPVSFLEARLARWEDGVLRPAELLLLDPHPDAIDLSENSARSET
jgi:predicted phage baseplate assembly protein